MTYKKAPVNLDVSKRVPIGIVPVVFDWLKAKERWYNQVFNFFK